MTYAGLDNGEVLVNSSGTWKPTPSQPSVTTVWSIAVNPTNGQIAFVVGNTYLYMTQNGGTSWTPVTPPSTCGGPCGLAFVAIDPTTSYLYASDDYTGIFQSTDNGSKWTQLPNTFWDVKLIVPNAAGVAGLIIVGSDQGLFLSTDSGTSWQGLNSDITSSIIEGVAVNGPTILTTVQDYSPIYTFDAGATWQQLENSTSPSGEDGSVVLNPANPLYAYIFTTAGFQVTADGGQTFTHIAALPGICNQPPCKNGYNPANGNGEIIAVDPNNASTVYAAALDGVYKSTDWGQSFTLQWSPSSVPEWPASSVPVMVAVDPADGQTIFVGLCGAAGCGNGIVGSLSYTHDGGSHWSDATQVGSACGPPVTLAFDPADPQTIMVGMVGSPTCGSDAGRGMMRSTDGGQTFAPAYSGLSALTAVCQAAPIPHLRLDPSESSVVAAATPGGVYLSSDFGNNWTSIRGNTVPASVTEAIWSGGYLYASTCGEGVLRLPFKF